MIDDDDDDDVELPTMIEVRLKLNKLWVRILAQCQLYIFSCSQIFRFVFLEKVSNAAFAMCQCVNCFRFPSKSVVLAYFFSKLLLNSSSFKPFVLSQFQ